MSFLDDLLAGGDDYRVTKDIGGAIFAPTDSSDQALIHFQEVVDRIEANDGTGYSVQHRLTHRSSDRAGNLIDRMVINLR